VRSVIEPFELTLLTPGYATLCHLLGDLSADLPRQLAKGEAVRVVVDTMGLKVFGEGG
jgi:hypothetical protein